MAKDLETHTDAAQKRFERAMLTHVQGKSDTTRAEALRSYEALLRLHQAPSVHMAMAMGAQGEAVLEQIDQSVHDALEAFERDSL